MMDGQGRLVVIERVLGGKNLWLLVTVRQAGTVA
jgi:hypothetical protein